MSRMERIGFAGVLGLAGLITLLAVVLVAATYRNDAAISRDPGTAVAEVVSVEWDRTIVRFQAADGEVHVSPRGVLYPAGLEEGQAVRVEYAVGDPELVRVAGRSFTAALLPTGFTVLVTWALAGPLLWWLGRRRTVAS